jgi:hypothetical protein
VNYQLEGIWIEAIASFYTILSNTERISSRWCPHFCVLFSDTVSY